MGCLRLPFGQTKLNVFILHQGRGVILPSCGNTESPSSEFHSDSSNPACRHWLPKQRATAQRRPAYDTADDFAQIAVPHQGSDRKCDYLTSSALPVGLPCALGRPLPTCDDEVSRVARSHRLSSRVLLHLGVLYSRQFPSYTNGHPIFMGLESSSCSRPPSEKKVGCTTQPTQARKPHSKNNLAVRKSHFVPYPLTARQEFFLLFAVIPETARVRCHRVNLAETRTESLESARPEPNGGNAVMQCNKRLRR